MIDCMEGGAIMLVPLWADELQPTPSSTQWVLQRRRLQSFRSRVDLQPKAAQVILLVGSVVSIMEGPATGIEMGSRSSELGKVEGERGGC